MQFQAYRHPAATTKTTATTTKITKTTTSTNCIIIKPKLQLWPISICIRKQTIIANNNGKQFADNKTKTTTKTTSAIIGRNQKNLATFVDIVGDNLVFVPGIC